MRPTTVSVTGVDTSAVVVPDYISSPFNVGIGCTVTGTATYTVEHTFDDVFSLNFNPATATWIANSGLTAKTTSTDGNYAFPVRGIRLKVTSGTGTVAMTVVQGLAH